MAAALAADLGLATLLAGKVDSELAAEYAAGVAAAGVPHLESGGIVAALIAASADKKNKDMREGAMLVTEALVAACGRAGEPYLVALVPAMLEASADKHKPAATASKAAISAMRKAMKSSPATGAVLLVHLETGLHMAKYQSQVAALKWMSALADSSPHSVADKLHELVPQVTDLVNNMKKEVRSAAEKCLGKMCAIMDNKDVQPLVPEMLAAMKDMSKIPECIHKMASLTFVQSVDMSVLGVLVPLLDRGFKEKKAAIKRQCAAVCANMSRLVDDPVDAKPFLPTLLPALERAADEVADPEARDKCQKAMEQLTRIKTAFEAAPPRADASVIAKLLAKCAPKAVKAADDLVVTFISSLAAGLVAAKDFEDDSWAAAVTPYLAGSDAAAAVALAAECVQFATLEEEQEEIDPANVLCDIKFTLAYGTKILLHNTRLSLLKGRCYGLLGGNDCGKSTLMREMAKGSIEGFPTHLRTVYVEADIQGEMSHLCCLDYVAADPRIVALGATKEQVQETMMSVGFTAKMCGDAITTLSGGWRMKLALSRAMLQKADILLMDEPTNHLDVLNVRWVEDYLCGLKDVTAVIVSHNAGLLDKCCTHMMQIQDLKLSSFKGNLSEYVKRFPAAQNFFDLKPTSGLVFQFPEPGFLDGVKSKGKALMKMNKVTFTYPGNDTPTLTNVTVQVSLSSRVACVGVNGAGKSTMINLLTGELEPCVGTVWKYKSARIAYVAQHAFHHIEQHLEMTASEYIMWRYQHGEDKENLAKVTVMLTPEEEKKIAEPMKVEYTSAEGKKTVIKRVVDEIRDRKTVRKRYEYLVRFDNCGPEADVWMSCDKLEKMGFAKVLKQVDARVEAREGSYRRALTREDIEAHYKEVGLEPEFCTHTRMNALSGGQKVKVVLGAAVWNQPHIIILDEPTNYLDRESLGALAHAIHGFGGGVVMITHNDAFCSELCPETWVLENGTLNCKGDAAWMTNALAEKVEFKQLTEMTDALGNTIKVKKPKAKLSRKEAKAKARRRKAKIAAGEELSSDDESDEDY